MWVILNVKGHFSGIAQQLFHTRLDYSSEKNCLPPSVWQHLSSIIIVAASQQMIGTLIVGSKK